ncbi:Non-reducing end alpha-L-arabinofuranosidase BoGH43A [Paramyrothecium foliicola]|nr:Non-reducing end alpha-L-arabinofuranosidase BoGH43A [Paramyrothecium foliicola]
MSIIQNPVLPGFYPDPSVIRIDDTYYMINSSFQFFPGLPIHTSKDLINWTIIGHAINRPGKISLRDATTKINSIERKEVFTGGLYAPTIRFYNDTFYIVCTNLTGSNTMRPNEDFQPHNFLIACKDLRDPNSYSDPINFDFYGIDPSLLFDDDGKVYMQGSFIHGYSKKPATVIRQAEIDLQTGQLLSEARDIWQGSGHHVPEGPHIYKRNGVYWLLIAEGGTHRRHKVTMAKATNVWGPYTSYENNPVLTARQGSPVTCVGHAELVEDTKGQWWAFMLARRELGASYPLGRETFMTPVEWAPNQFPRFDSVELSQNVSSLDRQVASKSGKVAFLEVLLSSLHTIYIRDPVLGDYKQGDDEKSIILQLGSDDLSGSPTFVGQRQTSLESDAQAEVNLTSCPTSGHVGLSVYKDPFRHASLDVDLGRGEIALAVRDVEKELDYVNTQSIRGSSAVKLRINSTVESYQFTYSQLSESGWSTDIDLGEVSCADMSGDDFTGTIYGIYAFGSEGEAVFGSFTIQQQL